MPHLLKIWQIMEPSPLSNSVLSVIVVPCELLNIFKSSAISSEPLLLLPSVAICGRIMTRMTRAWPRPAPACLVRMSRASAFLLPLLLHPPPFEDLMLPYNNASEKCSTDPFRTSIFWHFCILIWKLKFRMGFKQKNAIPH